MENAQQIVGNFSKVSHLKPVKDRLYQNDLESHILEFLAHWNEYIKSGELRNLRRCNDLKNEMKRRTDLILTFIEHSK